MRFFFILSAYHFASGLQQRTPLDSIAEILNSVSAAFNNFSTATRTFNGGNVSDFFMSYDHLYLIQTRGVRTIRETENLSREDAFDILPLIDELADSIRGTMQALIRNEDVVEVIAMGNEYCEVEGPPFAIWALLKSGILVKDLVLELVVRLPRDMIKSRTFRALEEIPEVYHDAWKTYGGKGGDPGNVPKIFPRRGPSPNCPKQRRRDR